MKNCVKFNSIEELNKACEKGLTIYSIAQCGAGWFVEYETEKSDNVEKNQKPMTIYDFMNKCLNLRFVIEENGYYKIRSTAQFKSLALSTFTKENVHMLAGIRSSFTSALDRFAVDDVVKMIKC